MSFNYTVIFSDILMEEDETPMANVIGSRSTSGQTADSTGGGGGGGGGGGRRERRANRQAAHLQQREREFTGGHRALAGGHRLL